MKRWWMIAGGCAVVALAVVAVFATRSPSQGTEEASPPVRAADQGPAVAAALQRLATDPNSLVASTATSLVGGKASSAVPAGSAVIPDPKSWSPDGLGGGSMLVTVTTPDKQSTTYLAVMVQEDGQWKVLATFVSRDLAPHT